MSDLDADNKEGVKVENDIGEDVSDLLKGSGKEYTPVMDADDTTTFIVRFEPRGETINVADFNFTTKGKLTVVIEAFTPDDEKIDSVEVSCTKRAYFKNL